MPAGPFKAYYSDGQTAASTPVILYLTDDGLTYRAVNDVDRPQWNYNKLTSIGPVIEGEGCQIGHQDLPGAILFVEDPLFVRSILQRAPQLSKAAATRRVLIPTLSFAALVMTVIAAIWYFDLSIAKSIAELMPHEIRKSLGRQVVESLTQGREPCDNPDGKAALDKMVARLTNGTEATKEFNIQVTMIGKTGFINAFAAPGEQIVVSKKLVKFVRSPDELAGIIAHEMGHGLELHPEAGIVRSIGISAGLQLILGGNAGQLGEMGAFLLELRYTRNGEREADEHAINILRAAQIRPKPFSQFFTRLEERYGTKSKDKNSKNGSDEEQEGEAASSTVDDVLKLLSTHPPLPERAKRIAGLEAWSSYPILNDQEWQSLQKICD